MGKLKDIVSFLDSYLKIGEVKEESWNGLQVEGNEDVKNIAFAVDAGIDTFKEAIKRGVDMVVVHHGHFWRPGNPSVRGMSRKRVGLLLENEISLYAAHIPLDRHREVGNNAQLIKLLGGKVRDEFVFVEGKNVGWTGSLPKAMPVGEIKKRLDKELETNCIVLPFGPKTVKDVAACSGGGGYHAFFEAVEKGVGLYLTGDSVEVFLHAKDAGINVVFAGHHATETLGLKALATVVKRKFSVGAEFIDIKTGL